MFLNMYFDSCFGSTAKERIHVDRFQGDIAARRTVSSKLVNRSPNKSVFSESFKNKTASLIILAVKKGESKTISGRNMGMAILKYNYSLSIKYPISNIAQYHLLQRLKPLSQSKSSSGVGLLPKTQRFMPFRNLRGR